MLILQTYHPLTRGLMAGLIYALVVWGSAFVDTALVTRDVWVRVVFAFAAGLAFQQVVDGAALLRGARSWRNPHAWMFAYVMGATWGTVMMLAFWDSQDSPTRVVIVWGFAALIFGASVAIWPNKATANMTPVAKYYRTEAPQYTGSRFLSRLYFVWPFVTWATILGMVMSKAEPGIAVPYIWYMMIFFVAINTAYLPKGGWQRQVQSPLTLGLLIMVATLFVS